MNNRKMLMAFRRTLGKNYKTKNKEIKGIFNNTFDGEGFYVNHKRKCVNIADNCYGYDKNWAYGGVLLTEDFPLSYELQDEPTELGIYKCKVTEFKPRYEDFTYTLYKNKIYNNIIFMTNLDYEIFTDMYESDIEILQTGYFKSIGKLPEATKKWIDEQYDLKLKKKVEQAEDYKEFKKSLEIIVYGKNAQRNKKFYGYHSDEGFRDDHTPIAMFQSAYLRYEEWKMFKKYRKHVLYMNTDSIILDKEINIKANKEIGQYGLEYDGNTIFFIRRNAYIVFNKDGSIKKQVISGITEELTPEKIIRLAAGKPVKVNCLVERKNGNIENIEVSLNPGFLNDAVDEL